MSKQKAKEERLLVIPTPGGDTIIIDGAENIAKRRQINSAQIGYWISIDNPFNEMVKW